MTGSPGSAPGIASAPGRGTTGCGRAAATTGSAGGPGATSWSAAPGSDRLRGGAGRDRVFGQLGSDRLGGGSATDHLVGGRGNDRLGGGAGADGLNGGLGDDLLQGGAGDGDLVIGGLGNDRLGGGRGDRDVLQGDFGRDRLDGGAGAQDLASFASAAAAVGVDLPGGGRPGMGSDRLGRIEDVVGSAFDDVIRGDAGANRIDGGAGDDRLAGGPPDAAPGDLAFGGSGSDRCARFEETDSCEPPGGRPDPPVTSVELARGLAGTSLSVRGSSGENRIRLFRRGAGLVVRDGAGIDPRFVAGCAVVSADAARCPDLASLGFVLVDGGAGKDVIVIGDSVPLTVPIRLSGGSGRDRIAGGRGDDVIDGGHGADRLFGHGGGDALVSAFDADLLAGGAGADLLVAAGACTGDRMRGGDGTDSASFARVIRGVVRARIGGRGVNLGRLRHHQPAGGSASRRRSRTSRARPAATS